MRTESVMLLFCCRSTQYRCRFTTVPASYKTILRDIGIIIDFNFTSRLHLHSIVYLKEFHIIAELNTKSNSSNSIGGGSSQMMEHIMTFYNVVFTFSFFLRIVQCCIIAIHYTSCAGKFQYIMLVYTPRRITALRTGGLIKSVFSFQ